jgi:hypothetical protein
MRGGGLKARPSIPRGPRTASTVHWEFPPNKGKPAPNPTWHDGDRVPAKIGGHAVPKMGVMFIGKDGQLFIDYRGYKLYPEDKFKGYRTAAPHHPAFHRTLGGVGQGVQRRQGDREQFRLRQPPGGNGALGQRRLP